MKSIIISSYLPMMACILLSLMTATESKRFVGVYSQYTDWGFLTRFTFLAEHGWIRYQLIYPQEYCCENLLFYYDEPHQWPAAYKTNLNCSQKEALLDKNSGQIVPLNPLFLGSGCIRDTINGVKVFKCTFARRFRAARARWWYIAISNCNRNPKNPLYMEYNINMTNGYLDWNKEFSADEFGENEVDGNTLTLPTRIDQDKNRLKSSSYLSPRILETDVAFFICFLVLSIASIVVAVILKNRQLFHSTYKYFMAALFLQTFGVMFSVIHYGVYAQNGIGVEFLRLFGRLLLAASDLVFLLMVILLAKGYTVVRGRISPGGLVKIAVLMTLYVIAYIALYIYEARFFDPGEVLYLYESPAGIGLIALRIIAWFWFLYANFITLKDYADKRVFYSWFIVLYTIWFLVIPVLVLCAHFWISKWARARVVNGIEFAITFYAYGLFLILTWPTRANSTFPFHIRTTQIGVLSEDERSDNFGGRAYAVDGDQGKPCNRDLTDMFAAKPTAGSVIKGNIPS
ncbi:Transmembrane protein 145 [Trichoplax sp. H2]|nr:Transmembrane protein 145 [Trichoplax sp. H2]|eukprot:RDD44507.1 Transmembrane protein 145 [Trichoplax sp. H2]